MKHAVNVLLIDDDESAFIFCKSRLKPTKYYKINLTYVKSLEDVNALLIDSNDIFLLDLMLEDDDWQNTFPYLKEKVKGKPIIMFSSNDDEEYHIKLVEDGVEDFFMKYRLNSKNLSRLLIYTYIIRNRG